MDGIDELAQAFTAFPGIGRRQARRFAFHIIRSKTYENERLAQLILAIKNKVRECPLCHRIAPILPKETLCLLCIDPTRDRRSLLVLEKESDLDALEASRAYKGLYFVLGGLVPIRTETTLPEKRIDELVARIENDAEKNNLSEVILGFSYNPEGEHTKNIIEQKLVPLKEKFGFRITTLGRGLSMGSELEYADRDTIKHALQARVEDII